MDEKALQELVIEVAKQDLREDEYIREQALQEFRKWIEKNPNISNCRTDDSFLLRFLRKKKFSVPLAEQTLVRFLKYRENSPTLTRNLDILDPALDSIVSNGYMFVSPYRDDKGRQVIVAMLSRNDPYKVKYQDLSRVDNMTYLTLAEDEPSQVLGYIHVFDVSNITFAHATIWPAKQFADSLRSVQNTFPMRVMGIHILHLPPVARFFFDIAMSVLSEKLRERCMLHNSLEELHQHLNPACLPSEYGGKMPASEMVDEWKKKLIINRPLLLGLDNIKIQHTEDENTMNVGSFRKLNVD